MISYQNITILFTSQAFATLIEVIKGENCKNSTSINIRCHNGKCSVMTNNKLLGIRTFPSDNIDNIIIGVYVPKLTLKIIPALKSSQAGSIAEYSILELSFDLIKQYSSVPKRKRITKYTLEIVLQRAQQIHENKYDYSNIKHGHIQGRDSHIPVKCNTCDYEWTPTIHSHITHKSNCPMYSRNAPWTLERFLIKTQEIRGNEFDYSKVEKEHIKNNESHIPVICKTCHHKWEPSINSHIIHKTKCPGCVNRIPWTLERLLILFKMFMMIIMIIHKLWTYILRIVVLVFQSYIKHVSTNGIQRSIRMLKLMVVLAAINQKVR